MRTFFVLGAATAALALTAQSPAPATVATTTLTIPLAEQNGSGEKGTAVLRDTPAGLVVVTTITGGPAGVAQPEHIHTGTCADLGGVKYPLKMVTGGTATTTVPGVTIAQLEAGTFAINVHESVPKIKTYVACGDVPHR